MVAGCSGPFCDVGLGCLLLYWAQVFWIKEVETGPIVTHLGPACAQTTSRLLNFGHMLMAGRVAMEESWQADVIIVIKESTFAIRQNK